MSEYQINTEPRKLMERWTMIRSPHDPQNPYFMMRRETAQKRTLSYEARGLLAFLLSLQNGWELKPDNLVIPGICSRKRVYELLKELELAQHLKRPEKYQDEKGKWRWHGDYEVYEQPYSTIGNTVSPSEPYAENRNTEYGHTKDINTSEPIYTKQEIKESLPQKNVADTDVETPGKGLPSKQETGMVKDQIPKATVHQIKVPRGAFAQQPVNGSGHPPKPEKPLRPVLPKSVQELIGHEVMGWQVMTDYHWKQVNAETLAKYLLPFNVTEEELRNFRDWYQKRFPDAPYTSPGILLSKLDLMRLDVQEGKYQLKPGTNGGSPKITITMREAAERAAALGISVADVYRQIDPNYLSPEERQAQKGKTR